VYRKNYQWILLGIITVISLHFKIFQIGSFGVSPALILVPLWTILSFSQFTISARVFLISSLVIFLPFVNFDSLNSIEFFKSYIQYFLSTYLILFTLNSKPKISRSNIYIFLKTTQLILLLSIITQFLFIKLFNYTSIYNIFGSYQLYYQLPLDMNNLRMKSFFLEPSYLGFVLINLFWLRLIFENNSLSKSNLLLTLISLTLTNSASTYIYTITLIILTIFKNFSIKSISIKELFLVFFIIGSFIFHDLLFSLTRVHEIFETEAATSGNMRISFPILVVYKLIFVDNYLMGIPFGAVETYIKHVNFIDYKESSISNSFFLLIAHFGLISLIPMFYVVYKFIQRNSFVIRTYIVLLFFSLNSSGAFLTIQFCFIAIILPVLIIKSLKENPNETNNNYSNAELS